MRLAQYLSEPRRRFGAELIIFSALGKTLTVSRQRFLVRGRIKQNSSEAIVMYFYYTKEFIYCLLLNLHKKCKDLMGEPQVEGYLKLIIY